MSDFHHASYLEKCFQPEERERTLLAARKTLQSLDFDAIAFSGMGGALFVPILARQMKKFMLLVRKENDDTHSRQVRNGSNLEGNFSIKRYVIVDDTRSTGKTANRIHRIIKKNLPESVCVAYYMYEELDFTLNPFDEDK